MTFITPKPGTPLPRIHVPQVTNPGVSTRRQVYFLGKLTDPSSLELFDAGTGKTIPDVRGFRIHVEVLQKSMISLESTTGTIEACDLVEAPALPGLRLTAEVFYDPSASRTRYRIMGDNFTAQQVIDDKDLAAAADPAVLRRDAIDYVGRIAGLEVARQLFANQGAATSQRSPPAGYGPGRVAAPAAAPATCPECGGAGVVQLFNSTAACSRGCKQKGKP